MQPDPPRGWTPELMIQAGKELITGLIGLLLIGYTLWIAARTLGFAGDTARIADAKDVLQVMIGLAGVVLGYYFGRIPADARAAQAQTQADAATAHAEQTSAQADAIADQVDQIIDTLPPEGAATRGLEMAATVSSSDLKTIRDRLRGVSRAGRRR